MIKKFLNLRTQLDSDSEQEFQRYFVAKFINATRWNLAGIVILNLLFGIVDYYVMPVSYKKVLLVRYLVVTPLLLVLLVFTFTKWYRSFSNFVMLAGISVSGISIVSMIAISQPQELGNQIYFVGIVLAIFYVHITGIMKLSYAVVANGFIILAYVFTAVFFQNLPKNSIDAFVANIGFLIVAEGMGVYSGFILENFLKNDFWQKKLIHNRQMALEKEIRTASAIQRSILPGDDVYNDDSLVVSARYLPMASVGGDFYDFIKIDKHTFGIIIADVSGHGVAAALISSMVKVSFHSAEASWDRPDEILQKINQDLFAKTGISFITAAYLCLNLKEKKAALAQAGHPPLYVHHRQSGAIHQHKPHGLPLALFLDTKHSTQMMDLQPKDRFFFCTDGLYEAFEATGSDDGEKDVVEWLGSTGAKEHSDALKSVEAQLKLCSFAPKDDITMVIVDIENL